MQESINQLQILGPSDVCTLLRIKESTLRKYAILLKDAGYHFDENERGQRAYYERDVIAIKKLIEIKQSPDMTLEQAANAVINWINISNKTLDVIDKKQQNNRYNDDTQEIKEVLNNQKQLIENQNELIKELISRMDQQQKYIASREATFMQSIQELQDNNKLLLESKKEQAEKEIQRDNLTNESFKKLNDELLSKLNEQQKYIDERLEQRDRKLIESLRESQEERKTLLQLAAAQEEEKKKGFFSRLFGK